MSKAVYLLVKLQETLYKLRLLAFAKFVSIFIRVIFSFQVSPGLKVGKNVKFGYGGLGTVIHGMTVIGNNVCIGTNVTIGGNFDEGAPTIMDNVYIATGAKILGNITIGENSIIAANSVITKDVPRDSIYGGIPGRPISSKKTKILNRVNLNS